MNKHDELCKEGIHSFKGIRVQIGWEDQYVARFEETTSLICCKNCGLELQVETVKKLLGLGKLPFSLTLDELLEIERDEGALQTTP